MTPEERCQAVPVKLPDNGKRALVDGLEGTSKRVRLNDEQDGRRRTGRRQIEGSHRRRPAGSIRRTESLPLPDNGNDGGVDDNRAR